MIEASWSSSDGADCIRLTGLPAGAQPQVRPGTATGGLPPMAGRLVRDGDDLCFVPRFPFLDGTHYTVAINGAVTATLACDQSRSNSRARSFGHNASLGVCPSAPEAGPDRGQDASTQVTSIYPTSAQVPRNLLRLYIWFSAPMSEGFATRYLRLADDHGNTITDALLPSEYELWDPGRRRLTVLLDPARIKRGLAAHREIGYPLRTGEPFWIVVDDGFRDARGLSLRAGTRRRYQVGADERRHVDPRSWVLTGPKPGTLEPVQASFDRPLDQGLLTRCLHVTGPDGQSVPGTPLVSSGERQWRLVPSQPWAPGPHQLIVDPALEDLAGNSVSRVFDRDLTRPEDDPRPARPVRLAFGPAPNGT